MRCCLRVCILERHVYVWMLAGQPYILEFYMGGAYRSGLVILAVPEESFCFPSLRALVVRVCARARARAHTHTHTHTHTYCTVLLSLSYLDGDFRLPS